MVRYIADFHIHSKYSRATSPEMELSHLAVWAVRKGIQILGSGDFTHPFWFRELKEKLEPAENGLYKLRAINPDIQKEIIRQGVDPKDIAGLRFILTSEVSLIYSKNGRTRRVHNLIFAPSLEIVEKINTSLMAIGNLLSDGRPILGLDSQELLKIILDISAEAVLIPAHAWTPWFSVFGSQSGFDSLQECFGDLTKNIFAIETGLSSDPGMNWRISRLDNISLISNSDAHSPDNLGREANIFEGERIDYSAIMGAIKNKENSDATRTRFLKFVSTIEFFPEEGKYHYDGHRLCRVGLSPSETKKLKGICPVCHRPLTIGVMHRIDDLADRREGEKPPGFVPYVRIIPLKEIIASIRKINKNSRAVQEEYLNLLKHFGNEFKILLDASPDELSKSVDARIAEAIINVRQGKVKITAGYDGEYGKIEPMLPENLKSTDREQNQPGLF